MQSELSVRQAVEARRSIRKYTAETVPHETVREIVRQAGLAPSAMNVQPWRVVAVIDPELKRALRGAAYRQAQVEAAPVVLVVLMDDADTMATLGEIVHPGHGDQTQAKTESVRSNYESMEEGARRAAFMNYTFLFVAFLALAAQGAGYATSVMGGFEAEKVRAVLGLPAHVEVAALVAMGRPAEEGFPHHRRSVDRILSVR